MNSFIPKTVDPKLVIITFGSTIMTDFAEGTFVEIKMDGGFDAAKGADGSEDRVNKNVTGADVTVTLKQTSLTNQVLSALHKIDLLTNQGKLPLTIVDGSGTTVFFSGQAYIKKFPDAAWGDSMQNRAWEFRATQVQYNLGGNL